MRSEDRVRVLGRLQQHAFGDLELEAAGLDAVIGDEPAQAWLEIDVTELDRRKIDRDLADAASAAQSAMRDFRTHSPSTASGPLLGDGNEVRRRDVAMLRMAPAQQRFDADDLCRCRRR